jgi:hypothetical protein
MLHLPYNYRHMLCMLYYMAYIWYIYARLPIYIYIYTNAPEREYMYTLYLADIISSCHIVFHMPCSCHRLFPPQTTVAAGYCQASHDIELPCHICSILQLAPLCWLPVGIFTCWLHTYIWLCHINCCYYYGLLPYMLLHGIQHTTPVA